MTILSFFSSEHSAATTADTEENSSRGSEEDNTPLEEEEYVHVEQSTTQHDASSVMSLEDHNVVVGFPPGTLVELMRGEDVSSCGGTILSSAASGVVMEPSPDSESVWAISPHPRLATGGALSISTTETVYRDVDVVAVDDDTSLVTCEQESVDERNNTPMESTTSFHPSSILDSSDWTNYSSINCDDSSSPESSKSSPGHDRSSFVNVGNRLSSVPEGRACSWYSNFREEEDWEQFHQAADAVMEAMGPPRPFLALPPLAPPCESPTRTTYVASQLLPEALVCPKCRDVIVGATTLSCGCTVCGPCWEEHVSTTCHQEQARTHESCCLEGVLCPSCHKLVDRSIPSHAMDVAILGAVQNASPATTAMKQLQQSYYYRLNQWRIEIQRRLDEWSKEQAPRREKMLAQCIQREEELLWKQQEAGRGWAWLSEAAIFLLAASIGVQLMVRR